MHSFEMTVQPQNQSARFIASVTVLIGLLLALILPGAAAQTVIEQTPQLTQEQAGWIGERIFANECNLKIPCLTSWNAGEDFPSLGIGHFIWYRENQSDPFLESFPALIRHYKTRGVAVPAWLDTLPGMHSPWTDSAEFHAAIDGPELTELRQFLYDTKPVQVEFIINRLYASVPALRQASDNSDAVEALFYQIANSHPPLGMYALIDYVNFKGEGTASGERYQGEGWGLLQVLEQMLRDSQQQPNHQSLLHQFTHAAKAVLARRVANSAPERNENRWTLGWERRAETYSNVRYP